MSKDMSFERLGKKKDANMQCDIWTDVMLLSRKFEEEKGATRQQIIEAMTKALLDLTSRRVGQRLFQHPYDTRRFLRYIYEYSEKEYFEYKKYNKGVQYAKTVQGEDLLQLRDAKNFGISEELMHFNEIIEEEDN